MVTYPFFVEILENADIRMDCIEENMNELVFRQAVLADLESLVPLFDGYRQFYGRTSDPDAARDFLRDRFDHGESTLFIAQEGGASVGFAQLYPSFSSVSLARTFILNDLYVVEQARRKGIARGLISATVEHARTLGAVRLSLATAIANETAQVLYQATGWTRDQQFLVYHFAL